MKSGLRASTNVNETSSSLTRPEISAVSGGLYRQTLTPFQVVGFIVLIVFYILFAVCVVFMTWPPGKGSMVNKIVNGYWLNFLLCIPLLIFFLTLRSSLRPRRAPTIPPEGPQPPLSNPRPVPAAPVAGSRFLLLRFGALPS